MACTNLSQKLASRIIGAARVSHTKKITLKLKEASCNAKLIGLRGLNRFFSHPGCLVGAVLNPIGNHGMKYIFSYKAGPRSGVGDRQNSF